MQELETLLDSDPTNRSDLDIRRLMQLTNAVLFFKQQAIDVHRECCRVMRLVKLAANQSVIAYGDLGQEFYIILQGKVSIFVPRETQIPISLDNFGKKNENIIILPSLNEGKEAESPENDRKFVKVGELETGMSFGELSLLYGQPRAASIVTATETILAVLTQYEFNRVLKTTVAVEIERKVEFLHSLDLFRKWRRPQLLRLAYHCQLTQIYRNCTLYKEGDEAKEVYFVINGEFTFTRVIQRQVVPILVREGKEVFGDREVVSNSARLCTCTCTSAVSEFYRVSKAEFLKRLGNGEIMRKLKLRHEIERKWLQNRVEIIEKLASKVAISNEETPKSSQMTPRSRLTLFLTSPSSPLPPKPFENRGFSHPRSLQKLQKTTENMRMMQEASMWRTVRMNDMETPCVYKKNFVIEEAKRSQTPKTFYIKAKIVEKNTLKSDKTAEFPDELEKKYRREAIFFEQKFENQLAASSHSTFRMTKRSSRPASHGRVVGRAPSPIQWSKQ